MTLEDAINHALISSVWKVDSVTDQPEITLTRWSIRHASDGDHFVGTTHGAGRVSTPVVSFDATTKKGKTHSGRVYELVGEPGHSGDAEHTWAMYKSINKITELGNDPAS